MATLSVTMAQFIELAPYFVRPLIYAVGGGNVSTAVFGGSGEALAFTFSPKPTEAAFLAAFPGAIKVQGVSNV
jgi:hypothetical protein